MKTNNINKHEEKRITSKEQDFSQWYQDIIDAADLAEHGPVKGTIIIKPYGYAIWESIQKNLDARIKETGVENAYFPLLIPENFLKKEESHVEGFSPEVAVVTFAGGKKLTEALIIRPTSETIIYDSFSKWIHSYKDLPILINQWANVIRWELRPRLFLRTTEFLWQEGHTAHSNIDEADERAKTMLNLYKKFIQEVLAIPSVVGLKSDVEKFAGAVCTYTVEAMMQDGKSLQMATSHNLGENFAKAFGLEFTDIDGKTKLCAQTSWGLSTRTIGGMIMVHSDNIGLKLPPNAAPTQLIIVPVWPTKKSKKEVNPVVEVLKERLSKFYRVKVDYDDFRVGEKFYKWEKRGVPLRMEIGPRDIKENSVILVRRDTNEKIKVPMSDLEREISTLLVKIQQDMFNAAKKRMDEQTVKVDLWEDFRKKVEDRYFVLAHWSGDSEVEEKIKQETGATIRCVPFDSPNEKGKCVFSGKPSKRRVLFAKAY
jgi:prolyl-tRNA synthetase